MIRKFTGMFLALIMVFVCCFAFAEDTQGTGSSGWGFSNFGDMQMPEMPSVNQEDWWGNFSTPEGFGSFNFDNFNSPATGSWGDLGNGMTDMSSAFEEFKNSTLGGMNKESSAPSTSENNSDLQDAFNQQKENVYNGMTQPSSDMQSLYSSVFGSDKEYQPLGKVDLPITFDQLKSKNDDLPAMNTSAYDQVKSIASTTKINSIMDKASSAQGTSLSDLPALTIGESAAEHNFSGGDLSSKYSSYASGLSSRLTFKPTEAEYRGLYGSQKSSLK